MQDTVVVAVAAGLASLLAGLCDLTAAHFIRQIVSGFSDQFVGAAEKLRFFPLPKQVEMLWRSLRKHEPAASRDFDGALRLQVAVFLPKKTKAYFRSLNCLCIIVTRKVPLLDPYPSRATQSRAPPGTIKS